MLRLKKQIGIIIFIVTTTVSIFATGPIWTQTDWSGGSGQNSWSNIDQYQSDDVRLENSYPAGDLKIQIAVNTGDGSDGILVVSTANTVVNNYAYLTTNASATNTISISNGNSFQNGDEILVIQMHNTDSVTPGQYEYRKIISGGGSATLTLDSILTNSYSSSRASVSDTIVDLQGNVLSTNTSWSDTNSVITQIVRIPQYTGVTVNTGASITADNWNGLQGGIVIFRSQGKVAVSTGANINADGMGYRGGDYASDGYRGEGWRGGNPQGGYSSAILDRRVQKYGGGGCYVNGAGGGYGTAGTIGDTYGGRPATAGEVYGDNQLSKIFPGGGGAGGHSNGGKPHGGNGGGIIIIFSDSIEITGTGSVSSDGFDGYPIGGDTGNWGAGGGAGGSVYLTAVIMNLGTGLVHADGGVAYDGYNASGAGGAGGSGRIRLDYSSISGTVNSPAPYAGGVGYYDTTYLISSIYDISDSATGIYKLSWNQTLVANSNITVKVRSSANSDMSGAMAWASVDTVVSNSISIKNNNGLTASERYLQYRVDISGDQNTTPFFEDISVEINVVPNAFSLLTPASGSENSITPSLDWEDATDNNSTTASSYMVELDDNSDFSSPLFRKTSLATSNYTIISGDGLEGHMTYYWRAWAKDDYPDSTLSSNSFTIKTANNPPTAFLLLTPTTETEVSVTPLLTWNKATDIDPLDNTFTYVVEIDDNSDFSSPLVRTSALNDTAYQVLSGDALKGHVTYYWRVWAKDSYPDSTLSSNSFTIKTANNPPNSFNLLNPVSGSEVSLTPFLKWRATTDIDPLDNTFTYVVEIDDNSDFSSPLVRTSALNDTAYQVSSGDGLSDNTKYYWRVWARDSYPDSAISLDTFVIFTDVTNNIPTLSTPLAPISNSERSLSDTLFWTRNDIDPGDTLKYNIRLSEDITFSTIIASKSNWLGAYIKMSDLDNSSNLVDDKIYHWQVEAHDPNAASSGYTSGIDSIYFNKTNDKPALPFNLFPETATTLGASDYLTWNATDGDSLGLTPDILVYTVIVDNNSNFGSPVGITINITNDSIKVSDLLNSGNLIDNTQYFWKVFAIDNHGLIGDTTSGTHNFWFNNSNGTPTAPTAILPVASSTINPLDSIKWTASIDSDPYDQITYVIEISNTADFSNNIIRDTTIETNFRFNLLNNYEEIKNANQYYLRIKAYDSQNAESGWAGGSSQTLIFASTAATVPTAITPISGAIYFPTELIKWSRSSDVDAGINDSLLYILQLSATSGFGIIIDSDTGSDTNATLLELPNYSSYVDNGTYYWRVAVLDNHEKLSSFSSTKSFQYDKDNNPPTTPVTNAPVDTVVFAGDSLFRWTASTDPDPGSSITYRVIASDDSLFSDTVLYVENILTNSMLLDSLNSKNIITLFDSTAKDTAGFLDNHFYSWKVVAVDNRNSASAFSETEYFYSNTVNDTPSLVSSLTPNFNALTFPTVNLSWVFESQTEYGDTTFFAIEFSVDSTFTSPIIDTVTEDTTVQIINLNVYASLINRTTYYWRVKSFDLSGNSFGYSNIASIFYSTENTAPSTVTGLYPSDSLVLNPTDSLQWSATTDPENDSIYYELWISSSSTSPSTDSSLMIVHQLKLTATSQVLNKITTGYEKMIDGIKYYFFIRATDEYNFASSWSSAGVFTFSSTKPSVVLNLIPDDSLQITNSDTLFWNDVIDIDAGVTDTLSYIIVIDSFPDFSATVSIDTAKGDNFIPVKYLNNISKILDDSYYYWKVRAIDPHGALGDFSAVSSFYFNQKNSAPNRPDSLYPSKLTSVRDFIYLKWKGSDPDQNDSLVYRVEFAKDSSFSILKTIVFNWVKPQIKISEINNYKTLFNADSLYYWRVRSTDLQNEPSEYSEWSSFVFDDTDNLATAPVIISPSYNDYVIGNSDIRWKNSVDLDDSLIVYDLDVAVDSLFTTVIASADSLAESADSITSIKFSQLKNFSKIIKNRQYYFRIYPVSRVDTSWIQGDRSDIWKVMFGSSDLFDTTGLTKLTVIDSISSTKISNIAISVDSLVNVVFPNGAVSKTSLAKITIVPVAGTVIEPDSIMINTQDTTVQRLQKLVVSANRFAEGDKRLYYIKERAYIISLLDADNPDSTVSLLDSVLIQIAYHDTNNTGMVDGDERIPVGALALFRLNEKTRRWELVTNSTTIGEDQEGAEILRSRDLQKLTSSVSATSNHFSVYTVLGKRDMTEPFGDFIVYPSPFIANNNSQATISYKLNEDADIEIRVYSRTGGLVWKKRFAAGESPGGTGFSGSPAKLIKWNGRNTYDRIVGNGVYIVKILAKSVSGKVYNQKQLLGVVK